MSKVILVLLFIQICATIALPEDSSQDCLGDSDKFYCKLNAKSTPYRFVANYNDSRPNYPGRLKTRFKRNVIYLTADNINVLKPYFRMHRDENLDDDTPWFTISEEKIHRFNDRDINRSTGKNQKEFCE